MGKREQIMHNNLEAIKKQDKKLYDMVVAFEPVDEILMPSICEAKDGTNITSIKFEGKEIYLNSQYRPSVEAEKFVKQYKEVSDYAVMIFMGFGNGIIARQLCETMDEHVKYIFYEPSKELFCHTIKYYDIVDIIENPNCTILIDGFNEDNLGNILEDTVKHDNYKICILDALPKYKQLFSDNYAWIEKKYTEHIYTVMSYIETRKGFGRSMSKNDILNMRHILHSNCMSEYCGMFPENMPAVIVSAGPSLEKNAHLLKQLKGKAMIFAVDTALRYLAELDIEPDAAIVVDPEKPVRLFSMEKTKQVPLLAETCANSDILDIMKDQKLVFVGTNSEYYYNLYKELGKELVFINNGGSVATVAYSVAKEWGFKRIILVGQDLALASDKVHAGNDDVDLDKLNRKKIAIEGYYGDTVYTTWDFNEYRKWFEEEAIKEDTPELINATEGGAKIAGALQMPLQEVIDKYCGDKTFDFRETIEKLPPACTKDELPGIINIWKDSLEHLLAMEELFAKAMTCVRKEIKLITQQHFTGERLSSIHKKMNEYLDECDKFFEIWFVDCVVADEFEDTLSDIYEKAPTNEKEHKRILKKLEAYLMAMQQGSEEIIRWFQNVIDEMEKQLDS